MAELEDTEELVITLGIWISTNSRGSKSYDIRFNNINLPRSVLSINHHQTEPPDAASGQRDSHKPSDAQRFEPEQDCTLAKPRRTSMGIVPKAPKAMISQTDMGAQPNQDYQNTHVVQHNGIPPPSAGFVSAPWMPPSGPPSHFPFDAAQPVFNNINLVQQPPQQEYPHQHVQWHPPAGRQLVEPPPGFANPANDRRSLNYKGNPNLPANQSDNIPLSRSCSLWITGLPAGCTYAMLLGSIRDCDKVFSLYINKARPAAGLWHAAAKLVFFSRRGVDQLLQQASEGRFLVGSLHPSLHLNDLLRKPVKPGPECRVIRIDGPVQVVNERWLRNFFKGKFTWEDDRVLVRRERLQLTRDGVLRPMRTVEWHFGSYQNQAQNAVKVLRRAPFCGMGGDGIWPYVDLDWGVDPCDAEKRDGPFRAFQTAK